MSRTPYSFQKLLWHVTRIGHISPSRTKTCTTSRYWPDSEYYTRPDSEKLKVGDIVGQRMWHERGGEMLWDHTEAYRVVKIHQDRNGRVRWELVLDNPE